MRLGVFLRKEIGHRRWIGAAGRGLALRPGPGAPLFGPVALEAAFVSIPMFSGIDFLKLSVGSFNLYCPSWQSTARVGELPPESANYRPSWRGAALRTCRSKSLWSPLGRGRGRCRLQRKVPAVPLR